MHSGLFRAWFAAAAILSAFLGQTVAQPVKETPIQANPYVAGTGSTDLATGGVLQPESGISIEASPLDSDLIEIFKDPYFPYDPGLSTWTAEGEQEEAGFAMALAGAGDYEKTGDPGGGDFDDIIVGAPYYNNGGSPNGGGIFMFYGTSAGLTDDWLSASSNGTRDAYFGRSVASAGDVNGDGFDDVIIGARGYAVVHYGGNSGHYHTYLYYKKLEEDNYLYLYPEQVGYSVNSAGDVNGDGYDDVIVGMPLHDQGRAFVYYGSANGLSEDVLAAPDWGSPNLGQRGGWSVASAGDVNGDGYDDVIVGAPNQAYSGAAFVFYGSATGLSTSVSFATSDYQDHSRFGASVSSAGDFNGDGYDDVIIGAPNYDNDQTDEGAALVYYGSADGPIGPMFVVEGNQDAAEFGFSVGGVGDMDGDGYDDVIVGAPSHSNGEITEGRVYLYYGGGGLLSTEPKHVVESDNPGAMLGYCVGSAGDVNGDGLADAIAGAPYYDILAYREPKPPTENVGRAYVFYGSGNGVVNYNAVAPAASDAEEAELVDGDRAPEENVTSDSDMEEMPNDYDGSETPNPDQDGSDSTPDSNDDSGDPGVASNPPMPSSDAPAEDADADVAPSELNSSTRQMPATGMCGTGVGGMLALSLAGLALMGTGSAGPRRRLI